jgi:hypothetical protein
MTVANPAHATVTAALAQVDAWRLMHTNGVAPTHKRALITDILYTATGVTQPVSRDHPSYVHYGQLGIETAVTHFDEKLRDPAFDWSSGSQKRALIIVLVDCCLNDLREDTAPMTVFGTAYASYTPTWEDANDDFIEDALQPPQLLTAPAVTGTPEEGEVLTVSTGTWTGPTPAFTYQWFRNGVAIVGATANTFTAVATVVADPDAEPTPIAGVEGDVGKTLQVRVTATNANGAETWLSAGIVIAA